MSINEKQILELLNNIRHPESKISIVELGMIGDIKIDNNQVGFSIQFSKPNDPFIQSIRKACRRIINNTFGEDTVPEEGISVIIPNLQEKRKIMPDVKNIIAIASGKGGVGKSTVAVNLSVGLAKMGYNVGLIDADVYGPSIPKMFDIIDERPVARTEDSVEWIVPIFKYGVKLLSVGFFVNPEDAVIWRGPMLDKMITQFLGFVMTAAAIIKINTANVTPCNL